MDRNREARRTTVNGLSRRRHITSSLRDSPEEDVPMELQDRGGAKKDRDRSRSKRRRGKRREEGGEESSEESVNDEEEEFDDDGGGGAGAMSNHHHRKILPPSATPKVLRPWKPADVPRKARSASTKRSQEFWVSGSGVEGEQINRRNSTSPAPISPPSSSDASHRRKMKPNGPKLRPPKSSAKTSSSNPEELDIEMAEVLYGMRTQGQGPSKKEIVGNDLAKFDVNKSTGDAKSRVSSPISNSTSVAPLLSPVLLQNSSSSAAHLSAVAPKRKRPRQVSDNLDSLSVRPIPISSTTKVEIDLPPKTEISSPNTEKNPESAAENGIITQDFACSQVIPPPSEPPPPPPPPLPPPPDSARPETGGADVGPAKEEPVTCLEKESPVVRPHNDHEASIEIKANLTISEVERQKEEKFEIDLMAPPLQLRSSPERGGINLVAAVEQKPVVPKPDLEMRSMTKDHEEVMAVKNGKDDAVNAEPELKRAKVTAEGGELEKLVVSKERNIDLQLDLEKLDRDMGTGSSVSGNKSNPPVQKQPPHTEKTVQSTSLPLPMSVASWPGGLPPMGTYVAPLQGVVSMDSNTVSPSPIQPLFSHPRPKRCATHSYIARNIHYLQQFMKMNPFWPAAAASSTPLFGAKPCNLNVVPSAELHGNSAERAVNSVQDKGSGLMIFPGHSAKDKSSQATNIADVQRKQQILPQQVLPPGAPPSNMLQAVAAAASVRPGSVKSPTGGGNVASTTPSTTASVSSSAAAPPAATAVSFNYPNAPASETQYLAVLQNNAYPFPIPAVGAPPTYRGTHAQPMPYFNGSLYSSQMIHPSQLQQQPPSTRPQNTAASVGSSSSHKHFQSQQQRPQSSGTAYCGNGSGNLHSFPVPKNRPSQTSPSPQQPNQHQARHLDAKVGGEDSPSTADSRIPRPTMSVYGQNFPVPIHPQNFALMTSPPLVLAGAGVGGNQGEKKREQQPQQQSSKGGVESHPPQPFAMSLASMNGVMPPPGMDLSLMAQNNLLLQSLPEANRHSYQIIAAAGAAQAAQQKKNFRASEEGKTGGGSDSSNVDEEKKNLPGKSITFSRPDFADSSTSTPPRATSPSAMVTTNGAKSQLQAQIQYQQQQIMQLQQHHQQLAAAAWNKSSPTSNGSVYNDHLASSASAGTKFPNGLSSFPQNLVQSTNSSPAQSPQWKNPARTTTSQVPSSLASSTTSSLKNLPQQQARTQQNHTQISFGGTHKSSTAPQRQQTPSPPLMAVGSPTTSSISKGSAGGSPRTITAPSAGNTAAQPSTLSSQAPKNSASVPTRKSSPVGNRNAPSILINSHITPLSNTSAKPQMQQQQQQLPNQQPQLFFSHAYMQAQASHSTGASSTTSAGSGYYLQRRQSEQPQQSQQPPQGCSSVASSTGMLSLCPVTLTSTRTSDAKAVVAAASAAAAAASNMKGGGGLASQRTTNHLAQSSGNAHPLLPPGFSYIPAVPSPVQAKPVEQKQPSGKRAT
ncbi:Protein TIME FOR COFFEE like [Actinidia chinensis var. chinensis]|uniref:Protein TIME FOR COFFEE like n=1 Tax=Actinidia chinensis var. chinensis TaxID=1590841 RepID=A0A2R6P520_ACTCC|nr:Protein TIME FOR COFFEE like [Actinidia chinensis var. chinensis]